MSLPPATKQSSQVSESVSQSVSDCEADYHLLESGPACWLASCYRRRRPSQLSSTNTKQFSWFKPLAVLKSTETDSLIPSGHKQGPIIIHNGTCSINQEQCRMHPLFMFVHIYLFPYERIWKTSQQRWQKLRRYMGNNNNFCPPLDWWSSEEMEECNDSVINLYRFKAQCGVLWVNTTTTTTTTITCASIATN